MTVSELKRSEKLTVSPAEVAGLLGMSPGTIRQAARERPDMLGFPVIVYKSRVLIPRVPLLRFLGLEA